MIHIQFMASPEYCQDYSQTNNYLGGGHGHDHQGKNLAIEGIQKTRVTDQQQVHRVQHQFDTHEHDERISAYQKTNRANAEYGRADNQ